MKRSVEKYLRRSRNRSVNTAPAGCGVPAFVGRINLTFFTPPDVFVNCSHRPVKAFVTVTVAVVTPPLETTLEIVTPVARALEGATVAWPVNESAYVPAA